MIYQIYTLQSVFSGDGSLLKRLLFVAFIGVALSLTSSLAYGQSGAVEGRVTNTSGAYLADVNVGIEGTTIGAYTGEDGRYNITGLEEGRYVISATSVGYQTQKKTITVIADSTIKIDFVMQEGMMDLESLIISGESEVSQISKEPVTITAVDAVSISNQAIGAEDVLKRSTGVLVRQQGGLGSQSSVNLNGLTGNAVRVYYDGIPLEVYGGGMQINNLPVNMIERVEVYKGIMPITVGTDALGGGINIIPKQIAGDFLQASYEYGSYNTHRATIIGSKDAGEKVALSGNLFVNHSQNDYGMQNIPTQSVRIFENEFGRMDTAITEGTTDANRFNAQHTSAYAEGNLTLFDRTWTDELTLSTAYSFRYDEYQHGPRVTKRPAGEAYSEVGSFIQRITYNKAFGAKVDLSYFGMAALTNETIDDSTSHIYNWDGNILPISNTRGSEILGSPSQREGENIGTAHRLTMEYDLHPRHTLALSNFFSYSRIEGEDPAGNRLDLNGEEIDPNTIPSHYRRNIAGLEVQSKWLDDEQVTTNLFYKHYYYRARSIDIMQRSASILPLRNNHSSTHGFGAALKWDITPDMFARTSFERTTRLPNEDEIYGNFLTIRPNYNISPERSNNLNLGIFYQHDFSGWQFFSVDVNTFLRKQEDLIRLEPIATGEQSQYVNEDEVDARGVELAVKTRPVRNLSLNTNFTYQKIALATANEVQDESFVGVQVPNIPDLFLNASLTYQFDDLLSTGDNLEVFWNYYFVDQFSVTYVLDESRANPENIIPSQHQHNIGVTYSPGRRPFTVSLQVNNAFDNRLYDNYRVPKPGFNAGFKINYSFNHN